MYNNNSEDNHDLNVSLKTMDGNNDLSGSYIAPSFIAENLNITKRHSILEPNEKLMRIQELEIKMSSQFGWYVGCLWLILVMFLKNYLPKNKDS